MSPDSRHLFERESHLIKRHTADVKLNVKMRCKKYLTYDYPQTAQQRLLDLTRYAGADVVWLIDRPIRWAELVNDSFY